MLSGPDAKYTIPLPYPGDSLRAIIRSYTKEHSAEYQAQALIDIGFALHARNLDLAQIDEVIIRTSHHTHHVIGTGSNDPQKMDPGASRETLDHSAMYILAVAWQDGTWHHVHSYAPDTAHRPSTIALWHKIRTEEAPEWTAAYHHPDPDHKKFGAEVVIRLQDGTQLYERLDNPNAHYLGARPFARSDYINKLRVLTADLAESAEVDRFLGLVDNLQDLTPEEVGELNLVIPEDALKDARSDRVGILP